MVELSSKDSHPDPNGFQWVLSVNGSSNQQGNGVGVILERPNGLLIEQALRFAFNENVACKGIGRSELVGEK